MKPAYYCPRCGTTEVSEYKDSFECMKCRDNEGYPLWFSKEFIGKIPDDHVLSIQELNSIFDAFEELQGSEEDSNTFLKD